MEYIIPDDENHPIFKHWKLDDNNNLLQVCGANVLEAKQENRSEETGFCIPDFFEYEDEIINGTRIIKKLESILVTVPEREQGTSKNPILFSIHILNSFF
jgi:hypothetical protein